MLTKLEKRKLKKKRKTALIVDNHPKIAGVKAVELVILPQKNYIKNTTHGSGNIQNFKFNYRKQVLMKLIKSIDRDETPNTPSLTPFIC